MREEQSMVMSAEQTMAKGANVNARTKNGDTALKFAREKRLTDVVAQLQKAGAKE